MKWEWLCYRLRGHYLLSKSRHLTSPQMLMSENKWLLHLGNLAQSIKTFPNIISKTTQPDRLLAKQRIIYLFRVNQRTWVNMERLTSRTVNRTLRVTLNEYASYFESLDWCKHHVSDAFFEIVSQLFYYIFFPISVALSSRNKTRMLILQKKVRPWKSAHVWLRGLKFLNLDHLLMV